MNIVFVLGKYDVIKVFMELINKLNEFKKDIESVEKI